MQTERKKRRLAIRIKGSTIAPYGLILPAFLVVFGLAAFGCYWVFRLSFSHWSFGEAWDKIAPAGLANYQWLLFDRYSGLWQSARTMAIFVVSALSVELGLGLFLALLLNSRIVGRSIYTAILTIPMVVMPSMVGMVWRLYFSYDGLVNYFIETLFHAKVNWYGPQLALPAVIIVDIWEATPFFILILLAGLQALPRDPYEAAVVDGASGWAIFRHITLPMLAPLILTCTVLRLMDLLRAFDVIFVMFAGGPGTATTTLPLYVYKVTMVAQNVGRGSAASVMLIMLIVALTYVMISILRRVRFEQ